MASRPSGIAWLAAPGRQDGARRTIEQAHWRCVGLAERLDERR